MYRRKIFKFFCSHSLPAKSFRFVTTGAGGVRSCRAPCLAFRRKSRPSVRTTTIRTSRTRKRSARYLRRNRVMPANPSEAITDDVIVSKQRGTTLSESRCALVVARAERTRNARLCRVRRRFPDTCTDTSRALRYRSETYHTPPETARDQD